MDNDLISVVIPIYKVEKYLNKCINSVICQTYTNIEIILVDDGSPDNCGIICDDFAKTDKRIKVIHKENGGLSDARNVGIENATGKYITFIDSDDYVELDYIEYLYKLIKKYKTKLSVCSFNILLENGKKIDSGKKYKEKLLNREISIKRMLNEEGFTVSAWAKLYSADLFDDIRYPVGKLCEDNGTTYKLFDKVDKIAYGNNSKYYYLKRKGSIMLSQFNIKKMDMIELTDEMCDYLDTKYENLKRIILRRRIYSRFNVLRQLDDSEDAKSVENEIISYILKYKYIIIFNFSFSIRDKLAAIFLLFGKKMFKFAWKLYCKVVYN